MIIIGIIIIRKLKRTVVTKIELQWARAKDLNKPCTYLLVCIRIRILYTFNYISCQVTSRTKHNLGAYWCQSGRRDERLFS